MVLPSIVQIKNSLGWKEKEKYNRCDKRDNDLWFLWPALPICFRKGLNSEDRAEILESPISSEWEDRSPDTYTNISVDAIVPPASHVLAACS